MKSTESVNQPIFYSRRSLLSPIKGRLCQVASRNMLSICVSPDVTCVFVCLCFR